MVAQLQQGAVPIQARAVPQSTFSPRFRLILDLLVYRSACSVCECVCVCAVQMALPCPPPPQVPFVLPLLVFICHASHAHPANPALLIRRPFYVIAAF